MSRVLWIAGWVALLAAALHSTQHFVWTLEEKDLSDSIWRVLEVISMFGYAFAFTIAIRRFRRVDKNDVAERVLASFLPLLVITTAILFVEQYFAVVVFDREETPERLALWEAIDIMYILTMGWVGVHLIRTESAKT